MAVLTFTIDNRQISAEEGSTILMAAREAGIVIPTLCHLEGVRDVGACRVCLVEVTSSPRLLPACTTAVAEGMEVRTDTERLGRYRRMVVELLLAERNHVCSVCVSNGHCELQDMASRLGIDHVRFDYQWPLLSVDLTHRLFGMDHNRCVLCTRCVRVCWQVEGAGTKEVSGRGTAARIVSDLNQAWGDAETCTGCGKCVAACPTGALFRRGVTAGEMEHDRDRLESLVHARERGSWSD